MKVCLCAGSFGPLLNIGSKCRWSPLTVVLQKGWGKPLVKILHYFIEMHVDWLEIGHLDTLITRAQTSGERMAGRRGSGEKHNVSFYNLNFMVVGLSLRGRSCRAFEVGCGGDGIGEK